MVSTLDVSWFTYNMADNARIEIPVTCTNYMIFDACTAWPAADSALLPEHYLYSFQYSGATVKSNTAQLTGRESNVNGW